MHSHRETVPAGVYFFAFIAGFRIVFERRDGYICKLWNGLFPSIGTIHMKEFLKVLKRFVSPYKKYLWGSVAMNMLSAVLNIFSFSLLIPMLRILFRMSDKVYEHIPIESSMGIKEIAETVVNNAYWKVENLIQNYHQMKKKNSLIIMKELIY